MPNSPIYRNTEQYPYSRTVPGLLILEIDAPIYFANAGYLRERITSWIDEEEERVKTSGENSLQYVILDMSAGGNIDTSGISMMEEIKKIMDRRKLKLVLVNPKGEVVKKLTRSKFIGDNLDKEWMFMTVGEAVEACSYVLHTLRTVPASKDSNNV
uniref:STAS domain-containing protein n=1 Tax=Brassica campestris TaxID=3711 RepID=M4EXD2_BRACM